MTVEDKIRSIIQSNQRARDAETIRVTALVDSIAKGTPYDYDKHPIVGELSEVLEIPGQDAEAEVVVGSSGEPVA